VRRKVAHNKLFARIVKKPATAFIAPQVYAHVGLLG
jgi:hypothetical protein